MKKLGVGEVNKCNQQGKLPKTMVKADGEMKTSKETVMTNPKGFF